MHHRHHYPNPDAVPYASTLPTSFPCQLTQDAWGKIYPMHNHGAWLNAQGDGNTDLDAGHFHRVKNFKVLPDQSDGHTHEMTMLPCTAGAARVTGRNGPIGQETTAVMAGPPIQIMGAGALGGGVPHWVWVVGALVGVAAVVGAVMYFRSNSE